MFGCERRNVYANSEIRGRRTAWPRVASATAGRTCYCTAVGCPRSTNNSTTSGARPLGPLEAAYLRASQRRKARAGRVRHLVVLVLVLAVIGTGGLAVVALQSSIAAHNQQANAQSRALTGK